MNTIKRIDNPADTSSNISIRGDRALHSYNMSNLNGDKSAPYQIDAEVLQNLPLFYRKAAAVFAASGKIKIIDTRAGGSAYE